jgi:hypothetical protein
METYNVAQSVPGSLHIEGLPDAVKLIRLDEPTAQRVGDLALHRSDLQFALDRMGRPRQREREPEGLLKRMRSKLTSGENHGVHAQR